MNVSSAVVSDRAHPEDRVAVLPAGRGHRFVVADGAGGLGGGGRAAELVVAALDQDPEDWCAWLSRLDIAVAADANAGESTSVVGAVYAGRILGASVGDSEAWVIDSTSVHRLTEHQHRARLGSGEAMPVAFEGMLVPDSALVVASDGLFRGASADAIVDAVRTGADARELAEVARGRSGRLYDDVGIVVVRAPGPSVPGESR